MTNSEYLFAERMLPTEATIVKAAVVVSSKTSISKSHHNTIERRRIQRLNATFERLAVALELTKGHTKIEILERAINVVETSNFQTLLEGLSEDVGV